MSTENESGNPAWFDEDDLDRRLTTRVLGRAREIHHRVGSTSDIAGERIRAGAAPGHLILAREQTAGRGRRGDRWFSPPGGLWFTIVLRLSTPEESAGSGPRLMALAAEATAGGIATTTGLPCRVRWPNDVLVRGRKLAGMLADVTVAPHGGQFVALGIGINAGGRVDRYPPELEGLTTLEEEWGRPPPLPELLAAVLNGLEHGLADPLASLGRYRSLLAGTGRRARVVPDVAGDAALEGWIVGVDDLGRLLLSNEGLVTAASTGRVEMLERDDGNSHRAKG